MPAKLNDFVEGSKGTPPAGVSVNKVLKAQQEGQDETNEKLTDIANMFVGAQEKASEEQSKYDAATMKALIAIDGNFEAYFNNLSKMSISLNKFVDPNYKMNKKEANQLQTMINNDKALVTKIDAMRTQDAGFNKKLEDLQTESNFLFRNKGIIDDEERRLAKKNNKSITELWGSISDNIEVLSTDVMSDLKTSLIEGIGGPYAAMARKVLLPMFKQIKESKLGQIVGDKFKNLGGFLKKSYKAEADLSKELSNTETSEIVDGLDDIVDESKIEEKKQKQKGVFKQLLDEQVKTNEGLAAFSDSLHADIATLGGTYDVMARGSMIANDLAGKSKEEVGGIFSDSSTLESYLSELLTSQAVEKESKEIANNMFEQLLESRAIQAETEEEYRGEQEEFQTILLEKLDDIEEALGKVDGDGPIGDALGLGIASALGPLITKLGPIGLALGTIALGVMAGKKVGEAYDKKLKATLKEYDPVGAAKILKKYEEKEPEAGDYISMHRELVKLAVKAKLGKSQTDILSEFLAGKMERMSEAQVEAYQKTLKESPELLDPTSVLFKGQQEKFKEMTPSERLNMMKTNPAAYLALSGRGEQLNKILETQNLVTRKVASGAISLSKVDQDVDEAIREQEKADIAVAGKGVGAGAAQKQPIAMGVNQGALKGGDMRKKMDDITVYSDDLGTTIIQQGGGLNN